MAKDNNEETMSTAVEDAATRERSDSELSEWVKEMHKRWERADAGSGKTCCAILVAFVMMFTMAGAFLALFSRMDFKLIPENPVGSFIGYGAEVFTILVQEADYAYYTGIISVIGLTTLFILDVFNWRGIVLKIVGMTLLCVFVVLLFVTCLLFSESFPSAPFGVFFVAATLIHLLLNKGVFYNVENTIFLGATAFALLLTSLAVLIIWVFWIVGEGNSWEVPTKTEFHKVLNCSTPFLNFTSLDEVLATNSSVINDYFNSNEVAKGCEFAFFLWVSPFIYFACTFCFSLALIFVVNAQREIKRTKRAARVDPVAQLFMGFITLSVLGMWVAASIASATSSVSTTILAFSVLAFMASIGVSFGIFGIKYMRSQLEKTPIGKYAIDATKSDWGKAFIFLTLTPVILILLLLNVLTQAVRKYTCIGKKLEDDAEKKSVFTKSVGKTVKEMYGWDWGSIMIKSLYWGILFFTLNVGVARITSVFLSWMREWLIPIDLGITLVVFVIIGLIMFLLPPVPGVPVYICGGIIITGKTEAQFGFIGALLFTLVVCWLLKLFAIICQQKGIGELFGSRSVYVRSLVSINSDTLRAMKLVLSKPGLHKDKVLILIGGPDWPTSVLTGIMRLPLLQMLLGSTPVIILIAPCVVSGAMLVKASEGGIYTSLNTISITLTFVIQSGSMLLAFHFLAKKAVEHKDELQQIPYDLEVMELDNRTKRKREIRRELGHWRNLVCSVKALHTVNAILMILSCYAFQFFGKQLFVTYDITDTIDERLDGNVFNLIIAPEGYYALIMFTIPCIYLWIFNEVQGRRTKAAYKKERAENEKVAV